MTLRWLYPKSDTHLLKLTIVAAPVAVVALTAVAINLWGRRLYESQIDREAMEQVETAARRIDDFVLRVAALPHSVAAHQQALGAEPHPSTPRYLRQLLDQTGERHVYGIYIAFEHRPATEPDSIQWVERLRPDRQPRLQYDFHEPDHPWYEGAKALAPGQPFYTTDPYFDQGGSDIRMISITRPVFDAQKQFIGVAGVDLALEDIQRHLDSIQPFPTARDRHARASEVYASLVSRSQKVIVHPTPGQGVRQAAGPAALAEMPGGVEIASRPFGSIEVNTRDGPRRIYWQTAGTPGWKVVLSVPKATLLAPVNQVMDRVATISGVGLCAMIGLLSLVAHRVTGPLARLSAAASAAEGGNYSDAVLEPIAARSDEMGSLARAFRRMIAEVSAREHRLKRAEGDLRRSERHFRSLIENASDIITVLDRTGVVRYESPSVQRTLGYGPEELIGRSVVPLVHPDDAHRVSEALMHRAEGHPPTRAIEFRFRHQDGSWRVLEATSTNLLDDPDVGGVVVNSRDVTERKEAELAIRRLNEELDLRVKVRTAELERANEELLAARDATEAAMNAQEIFLGNVAHDLRTPLTIVIGYSEDLLRKATRLGQEAFVPDLRLVVNRGKDLLELINDLLNLTRSMNAKGVDLDQSEFDVPRMLQSRMEGIGHLAKLNRNTVELHCPDDLGTMVADEAKVWRILMNLLTNACKFTRGGRVTLSARRELCEGLDSFVFQVTDTGVGMTPEQLQRLFHRFEQASTTTGRIQAGVGLGLSICMLYCKAMGGRIDVESQPGQGTTFTVRMPAHVSTGGLEFTAPARPRRVEAPRLAGPGVRRPEPEAANMVLIIDDDASVCELIERNLGDEGFRTLSAASGEEGLRLAKRLLPSAIILDVVMPGIDGWAVLAALKTDADTCQIPIIMATMVDDKARGHALGAADYVTKPFSRDRLSELLHKHLDPLASLHVLVVEDDAETRRRLVDTLEEQQYQVTEADTAEEALRVLGQSSPDLILLDLMLPQMNGFELIREVRKQDAWQTIPIVVVTGAEIDAEGRRILQGQVERILHKGLYSRDELLREIRSLVDAFDRDHACSATGGLRHAEDSVR